jgi:serine/threonine-protein kinase
VHAIEERAEFLAFAMGYVEGESVAERVQRAGPLEVRGIVRLLQDIGYALAYAHGRGVVHRDIKPDNIMIERPTGRALLMDFGISRSIVARAGTTHALTRIGEVVGTPEFMSPEQATGDTVDGRSDLYSLGLVALFALTGTKPITGTSTQQILAKQITELPPPATTLRADLPASLGAAIDTCVAKAPDERFRTAEALVEAIDAAQVAVPEIPLPIRLLAQELGTLGLIFGFFVVASPLVVSAMSSGATLDALVPIVLLFAAGVTRMLQVWGSAGRLMAVGFSPDDVLKGMGAVLEERESMRRFLRADAAALLRRRATVRWATVLMVFSVALAIAVRLRRVEWAPHQYSVGVTGAMMLFSGVVMFSASLLMLLRSPIRVPPSERLFRLVWLGPPGRAFVRRSARIKRKGSAAAAPLRAVPTATPAQQPVSSAKDTDRLAQLEARLAALEKERARRA